MIWYGIDGLVQDWSNSIANAMEWGRPSFRAQHATGWPHESVVAPPTTAPDAKTWSIPTFYHDHLGRSNQTVFLKQNNAQLNRYHQLQVNAAFLAEYVAVHARWRHNGRRM